MKQYSPSLNIVMALISEAQPLIRAWKLQSEPGHPFPYFSDGQQGRHLVVSGPCPLMMANAVGYLHARSQADRHTVYLNIGIAGGQYPLGQLLLIHKITQKETAESFYPYSPLKLGIPTAPLQSAMLAQKISSSNGDTSMITPPKTEYQKSSLFDLEGAAFFKAATRFVSKEYVFLLKIISDRTAEEMAQVNGRTTHTLVDHHLPVLANLSKKCCDFSNEQRALYQPEFDSQRITAYWHFTYTQSCQLDDLLRRWQALAIKEDPFEAVCQEKNADQVLSSLQKHMDHKHENSLY